MASLDRLANIAISLRTAGITSQSFSDVILIGDLASSTTRTLIIKSAGELLDMGLTPDNELYKCANGIFSQQPAVNRVFIGARRVTTVTATITASTPGQPLTIKILSKDADGNSISTPFEYIPSTEDTAVTAATALAAEINSGVVTATATGATIKIVATGNSAWGINVAGNITQIAQPSEEDLQTTLNACMSETSQWYGIVTTSRTRADVLAVATWAEANGKMYFIQSDDTAVADPGSSTDIASTLKSHNFFRTASWYRKNATYDRLDAAMPGKMFTYYPGQETWANQSISGIMSDNLTEGEANSVFKKNANTFETFKETISMTQNGKVAGGEWIDVIRFRDWLVETIRTEISLVLMNANGKIPYTNAGILVIRGALVKALELGIQRGGILPDQVDRKSGAIIKGYEIFTPRAEDISANDKANRVLNDLSFVARLAGAIHLVVLKGTLSY